MTIEDTISILSAKKLPLQNEKLLQIEIARILPSFIPEYPLNGSGVIDFFLSGVGIEVKITGNRKDIYRQCKRYCDSFEIKSLILVTNRAMGLPSQINGKPCYVVNLGKAWL
jgi:hypothetical protein